MSGFTKLAVLSSTLLLLTPCVWAVGADCKKPTSELDKRICQSATLTAANEALNVAFHNQRAWLCQDAEILRREDDWDCMAAKEDFFAEQRQWDKSVLAQCKTDDCFTRVYKARISQINGQDTPLPNFRLTTYGWGDKECQAYLKVLNRTPREEFRGCKLPDLSGSGFKTLPFKAVEGEVLKQLDKQIAQLNHKEQTNWQAQLKKYQSGYIKMEMAYLDIDGDGNKERLVRYSRPDIFCEGVGYGEDVDNKLKRWRELGQEVVFKKALEHGYHRDYYTVGDDGKLKSVGKRSKNRLAFFEDKVFSFTKNGVVATLKHADLGAKIYVEMDYIKSIDKGRAEESWCGFWYNY
ncbi:hypothetical protein PCIT_a3649 [Pseudoalteromonas citrea]|uniref:DUF1311 domain-containing protein n=2 Tax=Pseudoalteromonas citrea TaxID=43655 RepID=A0AAD4AG37_9GAMM|nr:hypothetical protein [Pseudoalteromonas citrea]KAF7767600.1 hypothetical protein PCIT_a3649 [Pseudoalteromonas citrea]